MKQMKHELQTKSAINRLESQLLRMESQVVDLRQTLDNLKLFVECEKDEMCIQCGRDAHMYIGSNL